MLLSDWGSLASILGLVLTGWALWEVLKLRRFYEARVRVPKLLAELSQRKSALANYLNDLPNSEDRANEELVQIESTLKALEPKLRGEAKRSVGNLLSRLRAQGRAPDEEGIKRTYLSVVAVIQEIKNLQEDREWQQK